MTQGGSPAVLKNLNSQIEFAKQNYENQQNIIRHLDVKAGVFVTALAFFLMNAPLAARDVVGKLRLSGAGSVWSAVYLISGLALVSSFLATAACVQRVIRVRGSSPPATREVSFLPMTFWGLAMRISITLPPKRQPTKSY